MVAILHFIPGHGEARVVAQRLMDDLPSGSFLTVTRFTLHFMPDREKVTYQQMLDSRMSDIWPRDRAELTALFDGLEMVDPGIVLVSDWRPEDANQVVNPSASASGRASSPT